MGVCPEHGNTLASTGQKAWCRETGCGRRWTCDRGGLRVGPRVGLELSERSLVGGVCTHGVADTVRAIHDLHVLRCCSEIVNGADATVLLATGDGGAEELLGGPVVAFTAGLAGGG
jgi:hypothetical protein